jgi:hypothetical protein
VISRRVFLAGSAASAAALALLPGCGDDSGSTDPLPGDRTTTTENDTPTRIAAGFADGYATALSSLVAGIPQRAPFYAVTDIGAPVRSELVPASIDVQIFQGDVEVATLTVERHDADIPTPYYPVVFTPPEPGDYSIGASFAAERTPFRVSARDEVNLVQIGEALRPVVTPTPDDARGVDPICTRPEGTCPFHSTTLTDAIAAGGPVVLIISTPGFCQTAICGPVLELLIEAADARPELTIVHAEVYESPTDNDLSETTEVVATYALDYEPTLFVTDATGTVTARLDFTWDRIELDAALATV